MQRAGANGFKREHPEQLAEAFDGFVEQRRHGLGSAVASCEAGATACDHNLHSGIGDQAAQLCADLITVIRNDVALGQPVAACFKPLLQGVTGVVVRQGAGIGHREQGNGEAQAVGLQERGSWWQSWLAARPSATVTLTQGLDASSIWSHDRRTETRQRFSR